MTTFNIKLVNKVIKVTVFNDSTKEYCKDFLSEEPFDFEITLSEEDLKSEIVYSNTGCPYDNEEISALYRKIAEVFIEHNIIVFHGSSFSINNNGFILTARSGVGKSTHSKLLKEYLKEDFVYINDDKPLIKVEDEVEVFSNPWNGKERRGNNISAPLKAIIFLNRGDKPSFRKIENKQEFYIQLMSQIYLPKDKSLVEKSLQIMDKMLKKINIYELYVNMDIESAEMTYERIIKNEIK